MARRKAGKRDIARPAHDDGVRALCLAIVAQAVRDYQDLTRRGKTKADRGKTRLYDKREIRKFFRSDWCEWLLEGAGSGELTGEDILERLQKEEQARLASGNPDGKRKRGRPPRAAAPLGVKAS